MSDLHSRYASLDHQTLYDMLMAGQPGQVDAIAAQWNKLRTDVDNLAARFGADLHALFRTWNSPSGAEYQDRVGAVVTFANTLAGEFGSIDTSLTLMSGPLREALSKAESPAETDDHDNMIKDAIGGAAAGSAAGPGGTVVGLVVGLGWGHHQDDEEKQRAHERMINLVANLASDYNMTVDSQLPTDPAPPPANLPHSSSSGMTPITGAGTSAYSHSAPATGTGSAPGSATMTTTRPAQGPIPPAIDSGHGTGLAGGPSLTDVSAAPSGSGGSGLAGGALLGGAAAISAGGLAAAARGIASSRSGSGSGGAGGTTGAASAGGSTRAGAGVAEGVLGREGERSAAGLGRASGAAGQRNGAVAGTGTAGEDEADERETWLTEDEMDWGAEDAAPSVLGSRGTAEEQPAPVEPDPAEDAWSPTVHPTTGPR